MGWANWAARRDLMTLRAQSPEGQSVHPVMASRGASTRCSYLQVDTPSLCCFYVVLRIEPVPHAR